MTSFFFAFYAIFLYSELNGTNTVSWWWVVGAILIQAIATVIKLSIDWGKARDKAAYGMYQAAKEKELRKA
jgi:hypothetical protein